jgi:molybdopterin guanine dinucleotide-containing S/N-oxide reductase-like protein
LLRINELKDSTKRNLDLSGNSHSEERIISKTIGFIGNNKDSNSIQVDVKNDKIVRIRPLHFDTYQKPEDINVWKLDVRGKVLEASLKSLISPLSLSYKKRVYSPNRVLYPLKRVDWDPKGQRNPQNRGVSSYTRISWDEALDIIVYEIRRIQKQYGLSAILSQSDGHGETKLVHAAHGCTKSLLDLLGNCTWQHRNPDSWEGWYWGAKHVWGMEPVGQMQTQSNVIVDIGENSEMVLFWGCDPETTPWGFNGQMASRICYWFTELGIKSIYICPDLNYGAAVHADKWIPIKPNTDAALQLAIAYVWIAEDIYDQEYVTNHTIGFDKFKEHVLGTDDGIPKDANWAAEKTGIPARTIKALAREWASYRTSIAHGNGGCSVRGPYSHETARLEVILLGMQGLGKPGRHQVKMIEWGLFGNTATGADNVGNPPLPRPLVYPDIRRANRGWNPTPSNSASSIKPFIPKNLVNEALNKESMTWYGNTLARAPVEDQFIQYKYPMEGCSEIHMIWTDTPCWVTCWNDTNSYIKGLNSPKLEFILAQHPWMENDCQFADLVLPVTTKFETNDINLDNMNGNFVAMVYDGKCIEALGESKSDYETCCLIADKLGLLKEYTQDKTVEEWIKYGFDNSGIENQVSFEEFKKKGFYVVPTNPEWKKYPVGMAGFNSDPDKYPLQTPSGKLEIFSESLAKNFPGDKERPPVPHWICHGETHQESLLDARSKKYPLLVISNHGRWRVHAQHDDVTWLREIETCKIKGPDGYAYQPVWINPVDAEKRGIKHGDIVKIFNERGVVLAAAYVTDRIVQDAISIDHGARYDPIVPGELDRGGAINTITPHNTTSKNATGMVVGGFLAEVELINLADFAQKYPSPFKQPYDAGAGLLLERVMWGTKNEVTNS